MGPQHSFDLRNHQTLPKNEVPCYACKEFRALKANVIFKVLFEHRARNFIFWKGLVIPEIKTMLWPRSNVSNLDSSILGLDCVLRLVGKKKRVVSLICPLDKSMFFFTKRKNKKFELVARPVLS